MGVLGLCFGLTSMAWAQGVASTALPTGGAVSAGAAAISSMGAAMTIQQSSQRAAINWQSFNIGKDASVTVQQPSSSSVLLNRIGGDSPSQILGRMSANGQIVLVNPNGMTFGKDGSVSAAGFTASTLGISDADFMAGNMKFSRDGATGSIVNQGSIQTNGGYVALLGASVSNEGKIETAGGNAYLAAAETVRVPVSGTGRIKLELSPASINAAVANSKEGAIVTQGGQVYMQAAALHTAMASVLQSGSIDTTGAQGGNVTLLAEGGHIQVDGRITANSSQPDQAGGRIVIGRDEDTGALAKSTNVSGATLESQGGFIETSGDRWLWPGLQLHLQSCQRRQQSDPDHTCAADHCGHRHPDGLQRQAATAGFAHRAGTAGQRCHHGLRSGHRHRSGQLHVQPALVRPGCRQLRRECAQCPVGHPQRAGLAAELQPGIGQTNRPDHPRHLARLPLCQLRRRYGRPAKAATDHLRSS
ncbi:MAG: filamentous hemagglutinin N-terminal domain-containing protein [Limnohabitans sp.]|nr:MAG: filamentous hemagglutinin N-terminal domain-containing protein [Limnohabitans sp.]